MRTDCWIIKVVLPSYCWSVILTFYQSMEGQRRCGGSVKVLPTPLTMTTLKVGRSLAMDGGSVKLLLSTHHQLLIMNCGAMNVYVHSFVS
jgi:hypothetical protein